MLNITTTVSKALVFTKAIIEVAGMKQLKLSGFLRAILLMECLQRTSL
ncbi:MAG: hypothetical protein H6Q73_2046 [Firmicutes bacterium]|nr:hypothetical protein [Bacillota bacterium]